MSATEELTYSDVSSHTTKKDLFVVIHDKIYNASSFVDEHPYVSLPNPLTTHSLSLSQALDPFGTYFRPACYPNPSHAPSLRTHSQFSNRHNETSPFR